MLEFCRNSIRIGGFSIHYYGILIALGALLGVVLAVRREKKLNLPKDTALDLALWCIPAAIVCARLYYVAFEWEHYRANLLSVFDLRSGGLAVYGGILGGLLAGFLYGRVKKLSFRKLVDLVAPSIALGQAVGRWGNFFNQEAFGVAVENAKLRFFPVGVLIEQDGLWHYATFFYESVWCLLIVAALLLLERRRFFRRDGDIFCWYAALYAAERAVVESLRTDSLFWGSVRVSQGLSLLAVAAVCVLFALRSKRSPALKVCGILTAVGTLIGLFQPWAMLLLIPAVALAFILYSKQ